MRYLPVSETPASPKILSNSHENQNEVKNGIKRINEIPGDEGFIKSDGIEVCVSVFKELKAHKFSDDEAIDIIDDIWWAASSEYGN